ncbi:putative late blight resistance protein homolog R1A-4 [Silene latifolia]|uniref:putative late blight resistance protein homolog R1A-4 n=1 Tax=Silene latifolia TaxID=37657 RepID=UPI003D775D78
MMAVNEEEHAKETAAASRIFWKVCIALAFCIAWYSRAGIFRCLNRIKGILCKCSVYKWLITWNCFSVGRDDNQKGYYEKLLEDLNCIEPEFENSIPSFMNKIQMLKLQVRYILPYVASGLVTVDQRYDKVKSRLRSGVSAECLDEFVTRMLEQTLHIKADATHFYCSASVSEYDCRKCADCVLDNLQYVQSLDMDVPFATKEPVKDIYERLRFLITFRMLVEKWRFIEVCTETKLTDIYKETDSLIRETAYLFRSFTVENIDAREAKAVDLEFTDINQKTNDCQLQAKSVYFGIIMEVLGLSLPDTTCPVKCEALCGFIVSLQKNLREISKYHFSDSKEHDIKELLLEMDFVKSIVTPPPEEAFVEQGKLNAISTHIDALSHEAESVIYSFVTELENLDNNEAMTLKVKDLAERVKLARLEVGDIWLSVDDFLKCFRTLLTEEIWFEFGFLRTLLRCTERWSINHPLLDTIKVNTENVICKSWWELRRFKFRKFRIEKGDEELESIRSCLLKNITVNNVAVKEVCVMIKVLKPSTLFSPMSKTLGLGFADALSSNVKNLQCCNPDSFSEMGGQLDDAISFLGLLHEITAMLWVNDKSRNDLLTHLEDLTERAACLSYIHLMSGADQTTSLNQMLLHNEKPELGKIFVKFIDVPIWGLTDFKQRKDEVMLQAIRFLISNLTELLNSESVELDFTEKQVNSLESGLNIMRCTLTDPLLLYYEQEELDDLLKEIGTGICELGTMFCYLSAKICREDIHCSLVEKVDCLKKSVSRAYMKYCKLSSSKLPVSELGFLESLLANLTKLKDGKSDYAATTMQQIEALHDELTICNSFLEQEKLKGLKKQILNVARKVEYVIDTFEELPEWYFRMRLADVTEELQLIKEETSKTKSFQNVIVTSEVGESEEPQVPVTMKEAGKAKDGEVIGFEDEEEKLIKRLCTGPRPLEINSIVGMPGSGKTTLAMKVYEGIASSFATHAWCYVSQNYEKKMLLQHILRQIVGPSSKLDELRTEDLALKLYQCLLKTKNYLIVLDDIWDIEAWNSLKSCFPPSNNGSRILLTSRFIPIGSQLSGDGACLELQPLVIEKSWHLLEKKVFGERSCPQHLREVGQKISKKCAGLPLSIVVIAGVLQNIEENEDKWREVEEGLVSFVKNQDGILDKLELSYNHLSVRMKQCFLYCGAFLRGKEIPRSRLARLWAAERFIDETDQQRSLDDAAERCLRDLVNRSLLKVSKTGSSNQIQNCRMHDLLRDFCLLKAEEETFLHIVHRWDSLPSWHRRLCFRRPILFNKFRETLAHTAPTRTLMFNPYLVEIASIIIVVYDISNFEKFKLLKVLDMECIDMGNTLPESITRLILLRYLAVRGRMEHIPPSIGELVNLETLIFKETTGKLIHVPETIFDLRKLRHLLIHDHASVVNNENSDSLDCLQSLATPALCNCDICDATIARLPNLQKLRCIFRECWDESVNVFPDLSSLSHLENLKVIYSGDPQYPCQFSFPSTLKKLTLSKFQLPWSEIETIAALLPELETLKLKDECFKGQKWVTDVEFPNLKYMSLEDLDIEEWETSEDCFPCLERLVVQNCSKLKAIPTDFSQVETLVSIQVNWCNLTVAESVEEIAKGQRNSGNAQFKTKTSCIELDSSDVVSDSSDHPRFEPEVYKQFIDVCRDPFGVASNMGA